MSPVFPTCLSRWLPVRGFSRCCQYAFIWPHRQPALDSPDRRMHSPMLFLFPSAIPREVMKSSFSNQPCPAVQAQGSYEKRTWFHRLLFVPSHQHALSLRMYPGASRTELPKHARPHLFIPKYGMRWGKRLSPAYNSISHSTDNN